MDGECYLCGKWASLERHHVFYGIGLRKQSEKYGAVVNLCHDCHNEPPGGVHFDQEIDVWLKGVFQKKLMALYDWTTDDFISRFGRNYL